MIVVNPLGNISLSIRANITNKLPDSSAKCGVDFTLEYSTMGAGISLTIDGTRYEDGQPVMVLSIFLVVVYSFPPLR